MDKASLLISFSIIRSSASSDRRCRKKTCRKQGTRRLHRLPSVAPPLDPRTALQPGKPQLPRSALPNHGTPAPTPTPTKFPPPPPTPSSLPPAPLRASRSHAPRTRSSREPQNSPATRRRGQRGRRRCRQRGWGHPSRGDSLRQVPQHLGHEGHERVGAELVRVFLSGGG